MDELSALAAECGIDWPGTISDIRGPGSFRKPAVLDSKYKGKSVVYVDEFSARSGGRLIKITFHTAKHGGISRTWVSRPGQKTHGFFIPGSRPGGKRDDEAYRRERFELYRKAFLGAPRADPQHPYLVRKKITSLPRHHDVRVLTDHKVIGKGRKDPFLAIGLRNAKGEYVGMARIYGDGTKKLSPGACDGQYRGAFSIWGDVETSPRIYVSEGVANCESIREATGAAVAFVHSAQNIEPAVGILKELYEDREIVIVADNDVRPRGEERKGNTGVYCALEAAHSHGVKVVIPPAINGQKTDANDIHLTYGSRCLRELLSDPSAVSKPARDKASHLWRLLPYASFRDRPAIYSALAFAEKVPFKRDPLDLIKAIEKATGDVDVHIARRKIRGAIYAAQQSVRRHLEIKGADVNLRFVTERAEGGSHVIGPKALEVILQHLSEGALVVVKSPMGTGKTEIVIKEAMKKAERAALVLPRVSVVEDAGARLGLLTYRDVEKSFAIQVSKMVTCVNSMGAERFWEQNLNWFQGLDLLVLDEASQSFAQLTQLGSAEQKYRNHLAMLKAVSSAKSILVADAYANQYMLDSIKRMDHGRKVVVVTIDHPGDAKRGQNIEITDSGNEVIQEMLKAVGQGFRCQFVTDNRKKAMKMERMLLKKNPALRVFHAWREPDDRALLQMNDFFKSPNEEVVKYDVMITTPVMTSGVSITVPHFQRHFGLFDGVVKVFDLLQMMGRDRTARSWLISVKSNALHRKRLAAEADVAALGEVSSIYTELKRATDRHEVASRQDMLILTANVLKFSGRRVTMAKSLERRLGKMSRELWKEAGRELEAERMDMVLSQPEITEDDYEKLKKLHMPTDQQAARMKAHRVRHRLCADLSRENVEFLDKGGLQKVRLMEIYFSPDSELEHFDREEAKTHDVRERTWALEKKRAIRKVFELLKVDPGRLSGEFTHHSCREVVDWFLANADRMNIVFDGIIDPTSPPKVPTNFVVELMDRLGIKVGRRKSNGHSIRFLDVESAGNIFGYIMGRSLRGVHAVKRPGYTATPP
jgi:hypothetical protein